MESLTISTASRSHSLYNLSVDKLDQDKANSGKKRRKKSWCSNLSDDSNLSEFSSTLVLNAFELATIPIKFPMSDCSISPTPSAAVSLNPPATFIISKFEDLVSTCIQEFINASAAIGPEVQHQAEMVLALSKRQKAFIMGACQWHVPDTFGSGPAQASLIKDIKSFADYCETNKVKNVRFLMIVAESVGIFGWIVASSTPEPFIRSFIDKTEIQRSQLLAQNLVNKQAVELWLQTWYDIQQNLCSFVKEFYPTGLKWKH